MNSSRRTSTSLAGNATNASPRLGHESPVPLRLHFPQVRALSTDDGDILALYAAARDQTQWHSVLRRISSRLGATGIALLCGHVGAVCVIAVDVPDDAIESEKRTLFGCSDQGSKLLPDLSQFGFHLLGRAGGRHLVVRLNHDGGSTAYATLYRKPGEPAFEPSVSEGLARLAPHLAQALALSRRIGELEGHASSNVQFNDLLPFGCFDLDATGSVLQMNSTARAMLDDGDGLQVIDGKLKAARTASDQTFQQHVHDVLSDLSRQRTAFAKVVRRSGCGVYLVLMNVVATAPSTLALPIPCVRLLVIDTDKCNYVPREVLQFLFDLTETESRMAFHLLQGETIEQAANHLGIARRTARHYVERIFKKTGTHRQSDLLRLTLAPFVAISGVRSEE